MQFGSKRIGPREPTYIIAEAGINHNGDVDAALDLVDAAANAGADAVKFQTYQTDLRVRKDNPVYGILERCELPAEVFGDLAQRAKERGIDFFSTPFDEHSVRLLDSMGTIGYKIASFDIVNHALLRSVIETGRPIIVSRGMANADEVHAAIRLMEDAGVEHALLHCISSYPTEPHDANLNVMASLRARYECPIGFSDHTIGTEVSLLAVAAGAKIVEKHFTLDTTLEGPDHALSVDPSGLREMVDGIRRVERILGSDEVRSYPAEEAALIFRRPSN